MRYVNYIFKFILKIVKNTVSPTAKKKKLPTIMAQNILIIIQIKKNSNMYTLVKLSEALEYGSSSLKIINICV